MTCKVLLAGSTGCGKTELLRSFLERSRCVVGPRSGPGIAVGPTRAPGFVRCAIMDGDGAKAARGEGIPVEIWDVSGVGRLEAVGWVMAGRVDVVILVFDLTDWESFHYLENVKNRLLQRQKDPPHFVIVGTKCDLKSQRAVPVPIINGFRNTLSSCRAFETASPTALLDDPFEETQAYQQHVDKVFRTAVGYVKDRMKKLPVDPSDDDSKPNFKAELPDCKVT